MNNLRDIIRAIVADSEEVYSVPGTVTSIDESAGTCNVDPLTGAAELVQVRLQAQTGKGLVMYPVIGSVVVVTWLSKDDAFVSLYSKVEAYTLATQDDTLKELLSDFLEEVANLKVTTNSGASIEVINKPQLMQLKNRVDKFFKE